MKKRTLLEAFAAAYLCYARYVNPVTGQRCDIHDTIERLVVQREKNEQNRGVHACFGYSLWKHPHARAYLQSTGASFRFFKYFHGEQRAVACAARAEAMWWCGRRSAWMEVWKSSADVRALLLFAWKMALFVPWGSERNFSGRILWYWTEGEFITIPHVPVILKSFCRACRREGHDDLCARARVLREYIVDKDLPNTMWDSVRFPGQLACGSPGAAGVRSGGGRRFGAAGRCGFRGNLAMLKEMRRRNPGAFSSHPTDAPFFLFPIQLDSDLRYDVIPHTAA